MLAGPVGPLNCGIGTFSAAELEKGSACRQRHKQWVSLLQAGETGGTVILDAGGLMVLFHPANVHMFLFSLKCVP